MIALGKIDDASRIMAEFYKAKPESVPIVTTYADVATSQGDLKLARTLLEKLVEIDPYSRPGNLKLAKILWESGERDEAAKYLERIAEVSPNDVASRALLGEYYLGKSLCRAQRISGAGAGHQGRGCARALISTI